MALNLPYQICACGCGQHYLPKRSAQRFYSRECRYRYYKTLRAAPAKTCPHYGKAI